MIEVQIAGDRDWRQGIAANDEPPTVDAHGVDRHGAPLARAIEVARDHDVAARAKGHIAHGHRPHTASDIDLAPGPTAPNSRALTDVVSGVIVPSSSTGVARMLLICPDPIVRFRIDKSRPER